MALADAAPYAVAHWALDETSGTRVDSVGANDLTDHNTVSYATGKFSNAADFEVNNGEYLSIADNTDLSFGSGVLFCLRFWVNFESFNSAEPRNVISKWDSAGHFDHREFSLVAYRGSSNSLGNLSFSVSSAGTAASVTTVSTTANGISTGTWYLIHLWVSSTEIGISVNAGTAVTASHTGGVFNGPARFAIGTAYGNNNPFWYMDGLIDDVVLLKDYILDSTERSSDYNSGTGVAFTDWGGGGSPPAPFLAFALGW
jgi:hypothetical protein